MSSHTPPTTSQLEALRREVRRFVAEQTVAGELVPRCDCWQTGFSRSFSLALGKQGWVGMTLPKRYGGGERSFAERFAVAEELLAAGAPVAAHWVAERQIAPAILRLGSERQREHFLPRIAAGSIVFGLAMSEPNSGSDLASVRTRALPVDGGWSLSGQKIWTSLANEADCLMVLCRTSDAESRHDGLSQLLVATDSAGVEIRRIATPGGHDHFCEVFFDDVFVAAGDLLGQEGAGWAQVTAELAFERGGPERYLSTFPLLDAYVGRVDSQRDPQTLAPVGGLVAELIALRRLASEIATAIDEDRPFGVEAALEKDAGTKFEQRLPNVLRAVEASDARRDERLQDLFEQAMLASPSFTLRGGTTEVLRGIVARHVTRR